MRLELETDFDNVEGSDNEAVIEVNSKKLCVVGRMVENTVISVLLGHQPTRLGAWSPRVYVSGKNKGGFSDKGDCFHHEPHL